MEEGDEQRMVAHLLLSHGCVELRLHLIKLGLHLGHAILSSVLLLGGDLELSLGLAQSLDLGLYNLYKEQWGRMG